MFAVMRKSIFILLFVSFVLNSCNGQTAPAAKSEILSTKTLPAVQEREIVVGASRLNILLPLLQNKRTALLVNQTSLCGKTHLADTLVSLKVNVVKIFAPEHGFRGSADAGEHVANGVDSKTNIAVASLYGDKKKPSEDDLKNVDVVVFDVQDVGARFYTFISTLHYLMEACALHNKELIVLDRPNPNGWYVDGPVLQKKFKSFVGVDEIPVVHGLTVGEYANMLNGEHLLEDSLQCKLTIVKCLNYDHTMHYSLPVKPSPNLPNDVAVYLYPSICYFEGTNVSIGRGTDAPLQMYGAPKIIDTMFSFIPEKKPGAKNPPHLGKVCYGYDLRRTETNEPGINLSYLQKAYTVYSDTTDFFLPNLFFDKLAGNDELRQQIRERKTAEEIKASWQPTLNEYKLKRKKYLLYKDFE